MILFDKEGVQKEVPVERLTVEVQQSRYKGEFDIVIKSFIKRDDDSTVENSLALTIEQAQDLGQWILEWQERDWKESANYSRELIKARYRCRYYQTDPWDNSDDIMTIIYAEFEDDTPSRLDFWLTHNDFYEDGEDEILTESTVSLDYDDVKELAQILANLSTINAKVSMSNE